ncbi:NADPH:quinone oxidoreductase family protein [Piscinibacter sakaiensis]|uniref:Oxidoreductase, zinc-binding dehydrogenase family n=1 Tax=Piscinibacter sakaiensis TaxID=1547922 RepID=A0A0K8P5Y3_PISS1|nr:NADPH:quinone oxidoreductase family protein [Piscinibacter sakaiensis]GAP38113.1 oxidoreductase, zinc-binding dehydrogenase family [Piscinibacter sakaiensis]
MSLPAAMRAWRVEAITEAGDMQRREIAVPVPSPDQYLVAVEAAGLAFGDTLLVRGKYQVKPPLPFTPGSEIVGRIVGGDGGPLAVGTRIASSCPHGGFADYALCPRNAAWAIGDEVAAGAALALRSNYATSLFALRHAARLRGGETLLVHAGAGGVGSAAVQLGKLMGARVLATAGGPDKVRACRAAGADEAFDYDGQDWVAEVRRRVPDGIDVVVDPVGGEVGVQSLRCLGFGARYLVIGFAGGSLTALPANRLLLHNASAIGVLWGEVRRRDPGLAAELTREIYGWHAEGRLQPLVDRGVDFEQAPAALAALGGRTSIGKVWLDL